MARYYLTFGLIYGSGFLEVSGQGLPNIQTDRPDQTECPFIVPKNHLQFENGFSFERTGSKTTTFFHPSTLSKFGVTDQVELRMITEFPSIQSYGEQVSGMTPVTVGFKANLNQEKKFVPTVSFIGHLTIPSFATTTFKSTYYAPSFRFAMQHTLSGKFSLGYNLGAEWNGESAEPTFIYTLTTGYSISEKTGCYLEIYGFAPQFSGADHRFDGGINYLLKKNILADISGGVGLTSSAPQFYIAIGFSFRIKD